METQNDVAIWASLGPLRLQLYRFRLSAFHFEMYLGSGDIAMGLRDLRQCSLLLVVATLDV